MRNLHDGLHPVTRGAAAVLVALLSCATMCSGAVAREAAAQNPCAAITRSLLSGNVYICPAEVRANRLQAHDASRLDNAVRSASSRGVAVKIAISEYPTNFQNAYAAARSLKHFLDYSGVLVLVAPGRRSMGVSSDKLNLDEIRSIEASARKVCATGRYVECATMASQDSVSRIQNDQNVSNHNQAIVWFIVIVVTAGIGGFVFWRLMRRRSKATAQLSDMRTAATNTLSLADNAIQQIEEAASTKKPTPDVQAAYDGALALRDQARNEIDRASTTAMLTQANQDAAQAVLALQGVMRGLGIQSALANPLDSPGTRRCFYCSHDDRPPYVQRAIDDGRGNSMTVDVCSVCEAQVEQGRRPQIATVSYNNTMVPWWAVPTNPYYDGYGGPTWQYWLPFVAGMDVGMWYSGGWGYGPGWGDGIQGYGDGSGWAGDSQAVETGGTADPSSDQGAGDFGGWGGDSGAGSGDSGGWGGDSGGWGGDSGGGDSGGW